MEENKKISDLADDQLNERIQKLTRIVYSRNMNLARQARPLLLELYAEQKRRDNKKLEEHLKKYGSKMDEVINIG